MNWSKHDIEKMQAEGKIRGFVDTKKPKKYSTKNGKNIPVKISKEKQWIEKNLLHWCLEKKVEYKPEHRFHPKRKWRFDWCIPKMQVAIEYEGLMSKKSRHTTISGFSGDSEKYNQAQAMGWKVLRYTAITYKNLITDLNKIYG